MTKGDHHGRDFFRSGRHPRAMTGTAQGGRQVHRSISGTRGDTARPARRHGATRFRASTPGEVFGTAGRRPGAGRAEMGAVPDRPSATASGRAARSAALALSSRGRIGRRRQPSSPRVDAAGAAPVHSERSGGSGQRRQFRTSGLRLRGSIATAGPGVHQPPARRNCRIRGAVVQSAELAAVGAAYHLAP